MFWELLLLHPFYILIIVMRFFVMLNLLIWDGFLILLLKLSMEGFT